MKNLILLMGMSILISSCNLFKNSSKEKFEVKKGFELDSIVRKKTNLSEVSSSGTVGSNLTVDKSIKKRTLKADKVNIKPDGSIEASGGVELDGIEVNNIIGVEKEESFENSNKEYAEEVENRLNKKEEIDIEESKKQNSPSIKGILIIVSIIIFVSFLILKKLKVF